jgi:hypothetical protein
MRVRRLSAPGMSMPLGLTSKATFFTGCENRNISIRLIAAPGSLGVWSISEAISLSLD